MTDRAPIVVIISADPRVSHRANEAMRIGLGLSAGDNDVTLILRGPGVHLLDGDTDDLIDGEDIAKFRAALRGLGVPFHVEATDVPADPDWNVDGHEIVPLPTEGLAELVSRGRRCLVF